MTYEPNISNRRDRDCVAPVFDSAIDCEYISWLFNPSGRWIAGTEDRRIIASCTTNGVNITWLNNAVCGWCCCWLCDVIDIAGDNANDVFVPAFITEGFSGGDPVDAA